MKQALEPVRRRAAGILLLFTMGLSLRCDPLNESCERVGECQLGGNTLGGAPAVGGGGTGGDTEALAAGENGESAGSSAK